MSSEADRLLITQIRQGDPGAWETLIARYEGRPLAFVERRLHDRSTSEDVVQETFIGFLNSLPHFDDRREVAAFLKISDQQVANYRFAAVKKLGEHIRAAGLPADVFPELQD